MHIPKTAGSSVADAFTSVLGPERCATFSNTMSDADFTTKSFVSGHVYLGDITPNAFVFTFVREPVRQLVSHLSWIDHYNADQHQGEVAVLPPTIQVAIAKINEIDLSDHGSVSRFLEWLPRDSELRVVNLQSEMLAFKRGNVVSLSDKELAAVAIRNLSRIGFVGMLEFYGQDITSLFESLGYRSPPPIRRINEAPYRCKIDADDPKMRRVLRSFVQADLRLYDHVLSRRLQDVLVY